MRYRKLMIIAIAAAMVLTGLMAAAEEPVVNAVPEEVTVITFGEDVAGMIMPGEEQWYKVRVEESGMLRVTVDADLAAAALQIYTESGEVMGLTERDDEGRLTALADARVEYWFYIRLFNRDTDGGQVPFVLSTAMEMPPPEFAVPEDAPVLVLDEEGSGTVEGGPGDWWLIEIPEDAEEMYVAVTLTGAGPDIDLVVTDIEGHAIMSSESGGPIEEVTVAVPDDRRLAARVYIYADADVSDYVITATLTDEAPAEEYPVENQVFEIPEDADELALGVDVAGTVDPANGSWYLLTPGVDDAGAYLVVELEGAPGVDMDLALTDGAGTALQISESGGPNERCSALIPEDGEFAARVYIYDGNGAADYTIRAYTASEPPEGLFAPGLPEEFVAAELGVDVTGDLPDEERWYKFHVEDMGNLRIAFTGEGFALELLNEDGSQAFIGTSGEGSTQIVGDANQYTDFYLRVTGAGEFSISSELVAGEIVALPSEAAVIETGEDALGVLTEADSVVWYHFTARIDGYAVVCFDAANAGEADLDLRVVSASGEVLGGSDSTESREAAIIKVTAAEDYYFSIFPYGAIGDDINYVIWVAEYEPKL